jgi:NADH:ubiquinone oxidoreductase subunit 5 (subunit L)/multisubunit Na+/H+ antiporter MnhA subunit
MLWLVPLVAILAAPLVALAGRGSRRRLAAAGALALLATAALAVAAVTGPWTGTWRWSDDLLLRAALDPVASVVLVLVPLVAAPVVVYAAAHEERQGLARLVGVLVAFAGAMELLVVAADFVTLLIGWELVGACSWVLIAHEWEDRASAGAAAFAFNATRLGDLGLFVAAGAAYAGSGSFAFDALPRLEPGLLALVAGGVLLAAAAKSAQLPFSTWLFAAMRGPTSVSALLHAATMVAAGAYLLARLAPSLEPVGWFAPALVIVGLATALAGSVVAALQTHLKRLLAASTSAHYGLMFVAIGAGYPAAALAHLVAHALFKALLFLVGGVASTSAGTHDLHRLRLGRALPFCATAAWIGSLALAGVPPLGGGWSKEQVAAAAGHDGPLVALGVLIAGGLGAFYALRFQLLAYGRRESGDDEERGPAPARLVQGAVGTLALGSVLLGVLWWPAAKHPVARWLDQPFASAPPGEILLSLLAVAIGAYAAVLAVRRPGDVPGAAASAGPASWLGLPIAIDVLAQRPVLRLAAAAARADDRWLDRPLMTLAQGGRRAARTFARGDDGVVDRGVRATARAGERLAALGALFGERGFDGLPGGPATFVGGAGRDARRLQGGLAHRYYVITAAGLALLAVILYLGG